MPSVEPGDPVRDIHDSESAQQIWKLPFVSDDLRHARQCRDRFRFPGRVTAHDNDSGVGIVTVHAANNLPAFGVAFIGDRACVDHAKVSRLRVLCIGVADPKQPFANELRFVLVDFATEGNSL